jgi:hypothetical protein
MNIRTFILRLVFLLILFFILDFLISAVLLKGLNKCYGIDQKPEILINGTSMAMNGFNRTTIEQLTKRKTANYSNEGVSVDDRYTMIDYFFSEYPKSAKTVIYEVNPVMFSDKDISENVYTMFYPYLDSRFLKRYIKERAGIMDYYLHKLIRTKRFDPRLMRLVLSGYTARNNIKTIGIEPADLSHLRYRKGKEPLVMVPANIEIFEETMRLIRSNNAGIFIVMMPMYYLKLQTYNNAELEEFYSYFETYCKSGDSIAFINLNKTNLIMDPDLFFDPIHLNVFGQRRISEMISPYLIDK